MKSVQLLIFILLAASLGHSQHSELPSAPSKIGGKIKSKALERTYIIRNGTNAGLSSVILRKDIFDTDQRLIQSSVFGNGEQRRIIDRSRGVPVSEVLYFDASGKPINDAGKSFKALTNEISESGLCSRFTVQFDKDVVGKVERRTETCENGVQRAKTTLEFGQNNELVRLHRVDSLSRSWVQVMRYDATGKAVEFRHTVDNLRQPKYTQTVIWADCKLDETNNRTSCVASTFDSRIPDQLISQYVEREIIEYYDQPTTNE